MSSFSSGSCVFFVLCRICLVLPGAAVAQADVAALCTEPLLATFSPLAQLSFGLDHAPFVSRDQILGEAFFVFWPAWPPARFRLRFL